MNKTLDRIKSVLYNETIALIKWKELNAMTSRILRAKQVKDLVKQFKDNGYNVFNDGIGYIVKLDNVEVFRALPDQTKRTYLVRYQDELIKGVA